MHQSSISTGLSTEPKVWDVVVVGAGAAGLLAAASAAGCGKRVLLLEKNRKLGVKILMSGGTRCNITHHCDNRGIVEAFGTNGKFLHSALASLTPRDVVQLIEAQGVPTKVEATGKIFPISDRAIDVRDALVRIAEQAGATILAECSLEAVEPVNQTTSDENSLARFSLATPQQMFLTKSLVITTGGKSYPGCGTTGEGYQWAKQFGHSIVTPCPALTPITSNCDWALELKGITLERVQVQVRERSNSEITTTRNFKPKLLAERESSLLFTHWGFSGPAALDVSREIARHPDRKSLELQCDFWPQSTAGQLEAEFLQRKRQEPKQLAVQLLPATLPRRFCESLMEAAQIPSTTRNADLSKSQIHRIIGQLKQTRFPVTGTLGFEKAEVTAGGVSLKEVDSKTMQSKLVEGLFFAGEVLDLDGRIGGFNFQSAFSTGWLAGLNA